MAASGNNAPKPTGFIIGAVLEGLLLLLFGALLGADHALLFVGLCGALFAIAIMRVATTPSDPNAPAGVDPDHKRIAGINRMFPQAVIVAAVIVAVLSFVIGPDTIHTFAREVLGLPPTMTQPFVRL
ncbi:MAG: hypothetical protein AAGJ70_07110 [Pseudomonadota bacterium]